MKRTDLLLMYISEDKEEMWIIKNPIFVKLDKAQNGVSRIFMETEGNTVSIYTRNPEELITHLAEIIDGDAGIVSLGARVGSLLVSPHEFFK